MELVGRQKVYLLGNHDVQAALERAFKRRLLLTNNAVKVTQELQVLGDDRHVQESLDDHVEILCLIRVLVQFST